MARNILFVLALFLSSHLIVVVSADLVETHYYTQKVDHFGDDTSLDQVTFSQRFYIDNSSWHGAEDRAPILVYFGGESPMEVDVIGSCGLITVSAPLLGALVLYIEHRFYGQSVPYGSIDKAMSDLRVRDCFTTSQALEDAHEIINRVQRNLSAENSPVLVMGGSYAGVLAALFRLRYPAVVVGAVASSAPMYYDTAHAKDFYSVITRDYQEINHDCHDKIRQSWKMIDERAKQPGGLDYFSETFSTCEPLDSIEDFKSYLVKFYTFTAQYSGRFGEWINTVCKYMVDPANGTLLEGIAQAIKATYPAANLACLNISGWYELAPPFSTDQSEPWRCQLCTELIIPFHSEQETMFPVQTLDFSYYLANCEVIYGVEIHPWAIENNDINTILEGSTSNIIFSNGLRDPYSSVGLNILHLSNPMDGMGNFENGCWVLKNIYETIVAINTKNGSHCLDMARAKPDDPIWLVNQRQEVRSTFIDWINETQDQHSSCSSCKAQLWIILLWLLQYLFFLLIQQLYVDF